MSPAWEPLLQPAANARLNVTPATFAAVLDILIQKQPFVVVEWGVLEPIAVRPERTASCAVSGTWGPPGSDRESQVREVRV